MLRCELAKALINIWGCAEQEAYRPAAKQIKIGRQGNTFGGAPNKRRTDPKGKRCASRTEKNFFVYTEETIYVMKETIHAKDTVDDLYLKFVIPVTAKVETLRFDRSRRTVNSWSTRRPHWRSAWKTSDGRPVRWGSVTVGVRKGSCLTSTSSRHERVLDRSWLKQFLRPRRNCASTTY